MSNSSSHQNPPPEDAPGILHPQPQVEAREALTAPVERAALIEQAAGESHHGVVREAGYKLGREEEAKLALEHTDIAPSVAWLLCIAFLLTIFSVPVLQTVVEVGRKTLEQKEQLAAGETLIEPVRPQALDVLAVLPSREEIGEVRAPQDAWKLVPARQEIADFEGAMEDESIVANWVLPRAQTLLAGWPGVGNEQAYIGRKVLPSLGTATGARQWLHYRPDVDYVCSRGFLDPAMLSVRRRSGDAESDAIQPDPIRAIVHFKTQLASRGITLILMPTPVKAMMHPETLSSRYTFAQGVLQNPSYARFHQELQRRGVQVFDVSPFILRSMQRSRRAHYLETDTHWTPEAMELSARELAGFIRGKVKLPTRQRNAYRREEQRVSNIGDIADMLKLPPAQTLFPKQTVTIHPVRTSDGELWYPERSADVLLLGDSFSNIYSLGGMNWGESAGLAEHLSFELQRPVDSITNNAGGSHVTRERLVKELKRGKNRLQGKRLLIWQFAMRDLLLGDWKILELPPLKS